MRRSGREAEADGGRPSRGIRRRPIVLAPIAALLLSTAGFGPWTQPRRPVDKPTSELSAFELLTRMEAVLPRRGTVRMAGYEIQSMVPRPTWPTRGALPPELSVPPFGRSRVVHEIIAFMPGFFRKHHGPVSPFPTFDPRPGRIWTVWWPDHTLVKTEGWSTDSSNWFTHVEHQPAPIDLPHEALFQPVPLFEWIDPASLRLKRNATHAIVTARTRLPISLPGYPARGVFTFWFPLADAGPGFPDRIRMRGRGGASESKVIGLWRMPNGGPAPGAFEYRHYERMELRIDGRLTVVSIEPEFQDAPPLPDALLEARDGREQTSRTIQFRLISAPPTLAYLAMEDEWRHGRLRLPYLGTVELRAVRMVLPPMLLLLLVALAQRARVRRDARPSSSPCE